jgi:uncharacterized protein (DUF362 family)
MSTNTLPTTGNTPVIGMAEAAEMVGISKSNFTAHRQKFSGEGQCPAATAQLTCGPVWAGKDAVALQKWADKWLKVRPTRAPRTSAAEKAAKAEKDEAAEAPAGPTKAAAKTPAKKAPTKATEPVAKVVPIKKGFGKKS